MNEQMNEWMAIYHCSIRALQNANGTTSKETANGNGTPFCLFYSMPSLSLPPFIVLQTKGELNE
jgi:hypothetical protein